MKSKFIVIAGILTLLLVSLAAVASAAPPDISGAEIGRPNLSRADVVWWWGDHAGRSTIRRSHEGLSGHVRTSLQNPTWNSHRQAVTLWLVVFNEPGECASTPCVETDLFNPAVRADVLYAAGNVVGARETITMGYHRKAGDNSGSIADLFAIPTNDGEPWGLIDPLSAEVHYVVRTHGPKNPAAMPAQIQTYGGGCVHDAPFGYLPPTGPGDLHMGMGDCQDVQFAINLP